MKRAEVKYYATRGVSEMVKPYAKGKHDLVGGIAVEAGARFVEWFMSDERVAARRQRRIERRKKRAEK